MEKFTAESAREQFGAQSAPLAVFIDPEGRIRYAGGLSRRTDASDGYHEAKIWAGLQAGLDVPSLPAFGCALQFGCETGGLAVAASRSLD